MNPWKRQIRIPMKYTIGKRLEFRSEPKSEKRSQTITNSSTRLWKRADQNSETTTIGKEYNSDINRRVRRDVEQQQILENDYENEHIKIWRQQEILLTEYNKLIRFDLIQIERDNRIFQRKRLNGRVRMGVKYDQHYSVSVRHIKTHLVEDFDTKE